MFSVSNQCGMQDVAAPFSGEPAPQSAHSFGLADLTAKFGQFRSLISEYKLRFVNGERQPDPDKLSAIMFLFGLSTAAANTEPYEDMKSSLDFIDRAIELSCTDTNDENLLQLVHSKLFKPQDSQGSQPSGGGK